MDYRASLWKAASFLRISSFFRWSELLVQLNSLLNPFLYCFALNHRFRQEILSMFNIRKREIQPEPSFERRSALTDGDRGDTKNASKSEEGQQQEHTPETLQTCEDIFLKPYRPLTMQKQTSTPAPNEVSRVTRLPDMHQTIPAKERSQMKQNLPNNNTEFETREPMLSSPGQVSRVTRVDVHQTIPAKERSQMEQNLPNNNDNNTEFVTREPMPFSPGPVSRVTRVDVHQTIPAKERSQMKQNLPNNNNNTEFETREPMPFSPGQVSRVTRVDVHQTIPAKERSQMKQNLPNNNNNTEFETREPMPSLPGPVSRVIRVDVHQTIPAKGRSEMEQNLPNNNDNNTEFVTREPMPFSPGKSKPSHPCGCASNHTRQRKITNGTEPS